MKKVLFISYYFPPMGGGGVQRIAKFCKYLPRYDYQASVIAAKSDYYDHPDDRTLSEEVKDIPRYDIEPPAMNPYFKKMIQSDLGHFLNWDQCQWVNAAKTTGENAIQKEKPDIICASVSPFPMAKLAIWLSEKYHIPWVLDMRDPWALDPVNRYATKLHYYKDLCSMKQACRSANAVVMNTPDSLNAARENFSTLNPDKFSCITNGWDAEDFKSFSFPTIFRDPEKPMTIVHTGIFHTQSAHSRDRLKNFRLQNAWMGLKNAVKYSIGNSNMLTRTPHYLFAAISILLKCQKITENDLRIVFAGDYSPHDTALAHTHNVNRMVDFRGYVDHEQSIQMLNTADVLFLPLHEPQGMLPLIVPGKTYEYLAARRPILAPVPIGDARSFVQQARIGFVCDPTDVESMATLLLDLVQKYRSSCGLRIDPDIRFIEQFERNKLTEQLALVFDKVIAEWN